MEPLALQLLMQNEKKKTAEEIAEAFVNPERGVETAEDALQGARDILAEQFSDDADARKKLRELPSAPACWNPKRPRTKTAFTACIMTFLRRCAASPAIGFWRSIVASGRNS